MSIETDVKAILDGYSGLTSIVSTRIYPVKLPQDPTYPNVVFSFFREIENTINGESGLEHALLQVDVRATTYAVMRSIVIQVKAAMAAATNLKSICLSDDDLPYEDEIETYRNAIRFSIWQ